MTARVPGMRAVIDRAYKGPPRITETLPHIYPGVMTWLNGQTYSPRS